MCGIAGITANAPEGVRKSLKLLEYRGPDASAVYADDNVTLGHNRLSIIDPDARSNQPFFDAEGEVGIIFNGEIYNFRMLRAELEDAGISFRTQSDTEVLVYAYKHWGEKFVERLEGMYAFSLYDKRHNKVLIYGDHASIKPLFYTQVGKTLIFASEMKGVTSLLKDRGETLAVDQESLDIYFALGHIPAPRTLFTNIERLTPASYLIFDLASAELSKHFFTPQTQKKSVQESIEYAVQSHLIADVPVGLFFSGGIDSSLIAAILRSNGVSLSAFCVEIVDRPEDAIYAVQVAKHLEMDYERYSFGVQEFDEIYDEVVSRIDEPFADSSLFPSYFVSKKAHEKVKVVLSGEGGDEYFFGYPRSRDLFTMRKARLDSYVGILDGLFFALPAFRGKNKLFERLFVFFRMPLSFYLLTMSPTKSLMRVQQWRAAKKAMATSAKEALLLDADLYLPNILLRKADLATMYASIEGRVPLLDKNVIAAAKEAATHMTDLPILKPALKELLSAYLPSEIVHRKKTGFGLRTKSYLSESKKLEPNLTKAITYLKERNLLRVRVPSSEEMLARYPNFAWQTLFLYYALKNSGI